MGFAIICIGCWKLAPGNSAVGYLTGLGIVTYLVTWVYLFYTSPRRIELYDREIVLTFFGGRSKTYSVEALKRPATPTALERMFDLVELADDTDSVRVRVWKDMDGWSEFVEALGRKDGVG